jgi:hypothetical protein
VRPARQVRLSTADDFGHFGWNPFDALGAGQSVRGLGIAFTAGRLGQLQDQIAFNGFGYNASDPTGQAQPRSLLIRANVVDAAEVPEPGTTALVAPACLALWWTRRRPQPRLPRTGR